METKEYKLLDGRIIRAKYDRLGMCKISQENLESFVKEFNASYRQAKILEKIKENYALMKVEERKKGKWINKSQKSHSGILFVASECTCCGMKTPFNCDNFIYRYCPNCGAEMERMNNGI